jgi:hypothetical protein
LENNVIVLFKDVMPDVYPIRQSLITVGQLRQRMHEENKVWVNLQLPDGSVADNALTIRQLFDLYYEAEILEFKRK